MKAPTAAKRRNDPCHVCGRASARLTLLQRLPCDQVTAPDGTITFAMPVRRVRVCADCQPLAIAGSS